MLIDIREHDEFLISGLSKQSELPEIITKILLSRNIDTPEKIKKFLYPEISDLYNPFLLKDTRKSVELINSAIANKTKILVFGDKDTDGITSVTILYKTLKGLGAVAEYMLPAPEDNYDLSEKALTYSLDNEIKLVITVDCGITANEMVKKFNEKNINVIITDHHEPLSELPEAYSIINPKQPDCRYGCKTLAGCGVAFKLASALILSKTFNDFDKEYLDQSDIAKNFNYALFLNKYLPVAAIGTIADVVPIEDENRIITRLGYEIIKRDPPVFLKVLLDKLKVTEINGDTIGYKIVPILNATRRMQKIGYSLDFLIEEDKTELYKLAGNLIELNELRKNKTEEFFEVAVKDAETQIEKGGCYAIVLSYSQFEHGVTGLVANKLKELFNKPAFIFITGEDGIASGAGRGVENGINLHSALTKFNEIFLKFGGHKYAVGMNIRLEMIDVFKEKINEYFKENQTIDASPSVYADAEIDISAIDSNIIKYLELFEPFGSANFKPAFYGKNFSAVRSFQMGADANHLNVYLKKKNAAESIRAIGWNFGKLSDKINIEKNLTFVFNIEENRFNGKTSLQLKILEIL
ncbi:MAG TPA: single-stranded-DNA-specific exonuclease RecJ [bacterium]|nr:single-stranded-DNA-specific exonuclease RecJ [bacterium]HPN31865.1 single-stranded-DNA-specific exonuclease RecJ [bacterium]